MAFDLQVSAANRHIADDAVDTRALERDCSGLQDPLPLGVSLVVHVSTSVPKETRDTQAAFPAKKAPLMAS